ncbi:hypothetical protein TNCV_2273231 [Trichonephila clavipes]|nr:hypothetical protein TNCV_2273231 [Trichonephila clavipes]
MIVIRPSGIVVSDANWGAEGLGSNPGEGMDVFKCIMPSRHGGTLNIRRSASPLVRHIIATPSLYVPTTNQVPYSPPRTATSSRNINSMIWDGGLLREPYAQRWKSSGDGYHIVGCIVKI